MAFTLYTPARVRPFASAPAAPAAPYADIFVEVEKNIICFNYSQGLFNVFLLVNNIIQI